MNAKLYKTEKENYVLVDPTKGTYDNGYMLGTSRESQYNKLSIKNCQEIERGYDLDKLVDETFDNMGYHSTVTPHEEKQFKLGYRLAFQKALEILDDKKFSEDDVIVISEYVRVASQSTPNVRTKDLFDEYQSLQQTEWDVEVEMSCVIGCENLILNGENSLCCGNKQPKLDADDCLILKRI